MSTADPDRTSRRLELRPLAAGLGAVAGLAGVVALATRHGALAMLFLAVIGVLLHDALSARAALGRVDLDVTNPIDGIVGTPAVHVVRATGLTTPVELVQPSWWPTLVRRSVLLRTPEPGTIEVDAPVRGVVDHLVLDLVATGPLGLTEASCRVRAWLPTPWYVGPAPLAHDPEWPRLRTVPPGESSTVTHGDDLFRGVRPYTRGDPRRAVHWPATAHRGALMVKERDGIEQVALRVVLELTHPGPDAELAAGRAAWLVDHGLARGWRVQLITAEAPPAPPRRLSAPGTALPAPADGLAATHTVSRPVERADRARQQLAAAGIGPPAVERWTGLTRIVSPWGDRWA